MKNKKGEEIVTEQIIFIILNLVFFLALILFVIRSGSSDSATEEAYAKKIALVIDDMQPRMQVIISAPDLFKKIDANNFKDAPFAVSGNTITVKTRTDGGYSFDFFSNISINQQSIGWDTKNMTITIKS